MESVPLAFDKVPEEKMQFPQVLDDLVAIGYWHMRHINNNQ